MNTLDRYEILGELGRGAISIVYDARDLLTDDPVALKLIESPLWAPPTSAAERLRFLAEAMPVWQLRHRNIVRVYDAGDIDGRLYIAMERLKGRTLRRVLDESPLPGVPRSLRMAAELASGLAHAHERGILHRYLKPSNIFVFADGRAKITDFGMAPLRDAALASSSHVACLSYMSPEEIRRDDAIDGRSDIFSLGVVLYEMLTGERPFSGDSPDEVMRNVLEAEPPLPSEVNSDVPPMVDLLVWSMLAKPPYSRAPSAGIIARRLRRLREEVDDALAAHAGDDGVPAEVATTAGLREEVDDTLTAHAGDDGVPAEVATTGELREEVDDALTAHAGDDGVPAEVATTAGLREEVDDALAAHAGDDGVPAEVATTGELSEEVDDALTAHAGDDGVPAEVATTGELREEVDDALAAHARDDGVPAEVATTAGLREEVDDALAAHARDDGVPAEVATTGELSEEVDDTLTAHAGDDGVPAEVATTAGLREEVDDTLTAHAGDDGVPAEVATTAGLREEVDDALTAHAGDDGVPAEVATTAGLREEVDDALAAHARDDGVPAEVATTAGLREEVDDTLTAHAGDDGVPAEVATTAGLREEVDDALAAHAGDDGVPAEVVTTADGRASGDRYLALVRGHRGAPQAAKLLRLPNYAWIALILAAAGSGLLSQWRQSPYSSQTRSAAISNEPATAIAPEPSVPDEPRLAASEPEQKKRASKAPEPPVPDAPPVAASEPEQKKRASKALEPPVPDLPRLAASEPKLKKPASKAPTARPSGSAVASGRAPAPKIQPSVAALATAPPLAPVKTATSVPAPARKIQASVATPAPPAKTATLVFDVSPWGEIYVDGKPYGTTPPVTTLGLPPGRHRIEVRKSAQRPYLGYMTLEPGDVRSIRHQFE